ncbi:DUF4303 domain-containing protein [Empedobacter falsenii]|uniref:DUF4303 domain-containing protein n=1 Tax=Empedobacter falsenii TaxID=343874 RepID=A0A376GJB5_9FLAO|nr:MULTISPECIES: DUF4303 domain-containing protein [Empedobacter]MDM1062525.1 DUF4303 domain-containing protein [Empedobacter falsenii]MDM1547310.1 DUF4303 domain-containing protein [Empedobacter falsenii]MDM1551079.1 DUF4303 domain-containing protein [Empedobacter falsenii]STD59023.1 Uncharacterised protein [Empedobacter falsenii]
MDFNELKNKLVQSTKQAFLKIYNENPSQDLYAFALCNNDSKIAIHPSANSVEHLEKVSDEDDFCYYKYEPSEWKYDYLGAENSFQEINQMCKEIVDEHDDDEDWFYQFQNKINEKCIEVLEELKNENFFSKLIGKDIFLNFSVIDDDLNKEKQQKIITQLNDNSYKEDYFEWMTTWGKNKKRAL